MPPGSMGLASPPPEPEPPPPMGLNGVPCQKDCSSGSAEAPNTGKGSIWAPAGRSGMPISSAIGTMCPVSAALSTLGGSILGRIRGVRMVEDSLRSLSPSSISAIGVMPPMGAFSKPQPMERAPISLPSM